jgi:DNA gyrase subunit B
MRRLSSRHEPEFLSKLVDMPVFSPDWDVAAMTSWCTATAAALNATAAPSVRWGLQPVDGSELRLVRTAHGVAENHTVRLEFFRSPEYRLIARVAAALDGLVQPGALVRRGNAEQPVGSFREAYQWLMNESRKGRTVQRFKGLGEMNPEQLWETTVNPETRRLLQVTIEDAVAADEIFTTLMGDEVEPRREFIESHALDVANLDV